MTENDLAQSRRTAALFLPAMFCGVARWLSGPV